MKLYYTAASPFARKVLVTAIENGLDDRIERIAVDLNAPDAAHRAVNPLSKVPALVRDDGRVLIDSPVICEYLDLAGYAAVIPVSGEARIDALHLQALGDGIAEAAVLYQNERNRSDGQRSDAYRDRQRAKAMAGFDHLEAHMDLLGGPFNIGQVAVACGMGWMALRIGREFWAEGRPALAEWYDAFCERPSMRATAPG